MEQSNQASLVTIEFKAPSTQFYHKMFHQYVAAKQSQPLLKLAQQNKAKKAILETEEATRSQRSSHRNKNPDEGNASKTKVKPENTKNP